METLITYFLKVNGLLIGFYLVYFLFLKKETFFNWSRWYFLLGIVLSLFGTIIPPILMNLGFPLTGIGLGSIVSALELPVSVLMAYFLLNETVNTLQWFGITLILAAIILMNANRKKESIS